MDVQKGDRETSRRQREAERFAMFRQQFQRNGGNAYRAALAAGYSERMARSKSYRLARLVRGARQLERFGVAASGSSHPSVLLRATAENSGETAVLTSPDPYRDGRQNQSAITAAEQGRLNNDVPRPITVAGFVRLPKKCKRWWFPTLNNP